MGGYKGVTGSHSSSFGVVSGNKGYNSGGSSGFGQKGQGHGVGHGSVGGYKKPVSVGSCEYNTKRV